MDFLQESIQELMDTDEEQVRDLFLPEIPDGSTLEEDIEADPEKWRKFWKSLTGDAEHKRTLCMQKMKGKVDDEAAFCNALYTKFESVKGKSGKAVKEQGAIQPSIVIKGREPESGEIANYKVTVRDPDTGEVLLTDEDTARSAEEFVEMMLDEHPDLNKPNITLEVEIVGHRDMTQVARGESTRRKSGKAVKEKTIFAPIDITILEQGDKEDEYFELAREASIRSGVHLSRAVTKAVKEALSRVEKPFDLVDVVLRRKPIEEDKPVEDKKDDEKKDSKEDTKERAECELLAACRLHEENKVKEDYLRTKAEAAAKAGTLWDRIKGLILHEPTQKIVEATFETVTPVWPAKELDKIVGKNVIVDTIFNSRFVGKLQRDGEGRYKITMPSGDKKFSMHDAKRILVKS